MTYSPSWINTLSTGSIAADMAAAISGGAVTYSGLLKLLQDLDATLASTKQTLSAAQFKDLRTIAANLNNGVTTPAYLVSIMKGLVNGSAANATWTGGAASAIGLGNLGAGSSATKLSELIGKWFLGTDLPSSSVTVSPYSFSVSYANVTNPVFGAGPSVNDINQGSLGDCYLLASLAEVASNHPNLITSMITQNGNDTYGVRFYKNGSATYVTVNNQLPTNGALSWQPGTAIANYGSNTWASLVEKGYTQLQAAGVVTGNTVNYGNSWSTIGNGGCAEYALEEITGSPTITDFCASGTSWTTYTYNSSLQVIASSYGASTATVQSNLIGDLTAGYDLVLSSRTNATDSYGYTTLVANHAMSVYGYDAATGMFEIRNPWGTWASGQYWDTTFEVSLSTLLAAGDTITVDSIGTNNTASSFTSTARLTPLRQSAAQASPAHGIFGAPSHDSVFASSHQPEATHGSAFSGFSAGENLELAGLAFGPDTTLGYSGHGFGGISPVAHQAPCAQAALLGHYMATSFNPGSSDHGGATLIKLPNIAATPLIANPHGLHA